MPTRSESKRAWWSQLSQEERQAFVARRGQSQKRWWQNASSDQLAQRKAAIAGSQRKATRAYQAKLAAMTPDEVEQHLQPARAGARVAVMTPEHRRALSHGNREWMRAHWDGMTLDERREATAHLDKAMKDQWAHMNHNERVERTAPGRRAAQMASPSSLEVTVAGWLTRLAIAFERQFEVGPYHADFYVPSRRLVIECDGTYWHNLPGIREKDMRRDAWLRSNGYEVLRLSDVEIKNGQALVRLQEIA
jgi:very-short-patch-repair endonuclease